MAITTSLLQNKAISSIPADMIPVRRITPAARTIADSIRLENDKAYVQTRDALRGLKERIGKTRERIVELETKAREASDALVRAQVAETLKEGKPAATRDALEVSRLADAELQAATRELDSLERAIPGVEERVAAAKESALDKLEAIARAAQEKAVVKILDALRALELANAEEEAARISFLEASGGNPRNRILCVGFPVGHNEQVGVETDPNSVLGAYMRDLRDTGYIK